MSEPTQEQIEAVKHLRDVYTQHPSAVCRKHALAILDLLPEALTNPQPALPTEPGMYQVEGFYYKLSPCRVWWFEGKALSDDEIQVMAVYPFTRLVPERPQVTAHDLWAAGGNSPTQSPIPAVYHRMAAYVNGTSDE